MLRGASAFVVLAILAGLAPAGAPQTHAGDTPTNEELFPRGQPHFRLCWRLEHDYYDLRERIAHAGVVWRRQQLELQWEDVRDRRRGLCSDGW